MRSRYLDFIITSIVEQGSAILVTKVDSILKEATNQDHYKVQDLDLLVVIDKDQAGSNNEAIRYYYMDKEFRVSFIDCYSF